MRTLILAGILLCACLSLPGCIGEMEPTICEAEVTLTQFEFFECEFWDGENVKTLRIEMTSTGESPVHIYTIRADQEDSHLNCEDFLFHHSLSEEYSTGASMEDDFHWHEFYVVFDHPKMCEEEDPSAPIAEISLKVIATY